MDFEPGFLYWQDKDALEKQRLVFVYGQAPFLRIREVCRIEGGEVCTAYCNADMSGVIGGMTIIGKISNCAFSEQTSADEIKPGLFWARFVSRISYHLVVLLAGQSPFLRIRWLYNLEEKREIANESTLENCKVVIGSPIFLLKSKKLASKE